MSHKSSTHGSGESYSGVVPTKQPNESGRPPEEVAERRPLTKENTSEPDSRRTPCRESGHSGLERVREAASKDGKLKFTALLHHVSIDLLRESYYSLKRKAAPGVDGMTWQEYGEGVEERLGDLHGRIHRGAYRARASRRTWFDKPDGGKRPLGTQDGQIHRAPENDRQAHGSEAQRTTAKLRQRVHESPKETGKWLVQVVRGYFQYHAIPGNWVRLKAYRPARCAGHVVSNAPASKPTQPSDMGEISGRSG